MPEQETPVSTRRQPKEAQPVVSFSAVMVYATLTLIVIVAAWLVMRSLGQRPLLTIRADDPRPPGWMPLTNQQQSFTFDVPAEWQQIDRQREPDQFTVAITGSGRYQAAVKPWSALVPDLELLLIATSQETAGGSDEPVFLVVAGSTRLNRLTPAQTLALIEAYTAEATPEVSHQDAGLRENLRGEAQASFIMTIPYDHIQLQCRQEVVRSRRESFVVAGCAPAAAYRRHLSDLRRILNSFQALTP